MDLHDYLVILRARWVSIVAVTAAGLALGVLGWLIFPASYTAESAVLISVRDGDTAREILGGSSFAAAQVQSYAEVARSAFVQQPALEELGIAYTPDVLEQIDIGVEVVPSTSIIKVSTTTNDRAQATAIASGVASQLLSAIEKLSPSDPNGKRTVIATLIAPAQEPTTASAPKLVPLLTVGLLVGLGLGLVQALLRGPVRPKSAREPLT